MRSRFWLWLAVLLAFGGCLRVAYVLTVTRHDHHVYDAVYYQLEAASIARGDGFVDPFAGIVAPGSKPQASAEHGPLTSLVLAPAGLVDDVDTSALLMRFTMVLRLTMDLPIPVTGKFLIYDIAGGSQNTDTFSKQL